MLPSSGYKTRVRLCYVFFFFLCNVNYYHYLLFRFSDTVNKLNETKLNISAAIL